MDIASLSKSIWIKSISIWLTFIYSCRAIWLCYRSTVVPEVIFNALIHEWIDKLLALIQAKVIVHNPHRIELTPGETYIIMCNHSSLYDIPLTYKAFPNAKLRMLAKKELSWIPFFGHAMKKMGFPFIDRKNKTKAIEDLRNAQKLMENGFVLWIAPEGTRSKSGALLPFKKGGFITAIQANATIIPLAIKGAYDILSRAPRRIKLNQTIELHIGKPIKAGEFTLTNKEKLIEKTSNQIASLLGEEH